MRISDRIATLDLAAGAARAAADAAPFAIFSLDDQLNILAANSRAARYERAGFIRTAQDRFAFTHPPSQKRLLDLVKRSEEHTSELQSLMRISYAVFCVQK